MRRTIAVGTCALALTAAAAATAMATSERTATTAENQTTTTVPIEGVATARVAPATIQGVADHLPDGYTIDSASVVTGSRTDYDDITATGPDGTLGITIYRTFEVEELRGLEVLASERGRAWVGATDGDLSSIYYLSPDGVGLWVAHEGAQAEKRPPAFLLGVAADLATDPAISEAAGR